MPASTSMDGQMAMLVALEAGERDGVKRRGGASPAHDGACASGEHASAGRPRGGGHARQRQEASLAERWRLGWCARCAVRWLNIKEENQERG